MDKDRIIVRSKDVS